MKNNIWNQLSVYTSMVALCFLLTACKEKNTKDSDQKNNTTEKTAALVENKEKKNKEEKNKEEKNKEEKNKEEDIENEDEKSDTVASAEKSESLLASAEDEDTQSSEKGGSAGNKIAEAEDHGMEKNQKIALKKLLNKLIMAGSTSPEKKSTQAFGIAPNTGNRPLFAFENRRWS